MRWRLLLDRKFFKGVIFAVFMDTKDNNRKGWPSSLAEGEYVNPNDFPEIHKNYLNGIRDEMEGQGLYHDAKNILVPIDFASSCIDELKPAEKYEEYLRRKDTFSDHSESKLIIELSNPEGIQEFDILINELNLQIDSIRQKKDYKKLESIIDRAKEIFKRHSA